MKAWLSLALTLATALRLCASVLVYEGFHPEDYGNPTGNATKTASDSIPTGTHTLGVTTERWSNMGGSQVKVYSPDYGLALPEVMQTAGFETLGGSIGLNPDGNNADIRAMSHTLAGAPFARSSGKLYLRMLLNLDSVAAGRLSSLTDLTPDVLKQNYFGFGFAQANNEYSLLRSTKPAIAFLIWKNKSNQFVLSLAMTDDAGSLTHYPVLTGITLGKTYLCYAEIDVNAGTNENEILRANAVATDDFAPGAPWATLVNDSDSVEANIITPTSYPRVMAVAGPYGTNHGYFRADEIMVASELSDILLTLVIDPALPLPALTANPILTRTSASLSGSLLACGTDATSVDLSVAIAPSGTPLPADTPYAANLSAGDPLSIDFSGLRWGTAYDYRLTFLNDLGQSYVHTGSFTTEPEPPCFFSYGIGLWEVHLKTRGDDWTSDPWSIPEGLAATERHRELGAEMAYCKNSRTSTINNTPYSWANNSTYAYVGYVHLPAQTTFLFESSIDDTAYLKIGDTVVHDIRTFTNGARSTWTSGEEGWYPIDLRVGDYTGNHGPIDNTAGFRFSTDNGITWNLFRDPGDGSFLALHSDAGLSLLSVVNTGSKLRLEIGFSQGLFGADLTACFSSTYGGEDTTLWSPTALAPVGSDETYRSLSIDIPADARFFRLLANQNGALCWTPTIALEDLPVVAATLPSATPGSVLETSLDTATFIANVIHPGDGFSACDLEVAYGTTPSVLTHSASFPAKAIGAHTLSLSGLLPERTYFAKLRASNASGASEWSAPFSFETATISLPSYNTAADLAGLWQARVDGDGRDWTTSILDLPHGFGANDRRRTLGTQMAYSAANRPNDFNPSITDAWREHCVWVYQGYIHLEAGTYRFRSSFDDTLRIVFGDSIAYHINDYTPNASGSWTCPTTGWYPLDLRLGNITVSAGPIDTGKPEHALQFSTDNGITWHTFLDPGDGSLLRTANPDLRTLAVESYSTTNNILTATLSFGGTVTDTQPLFVAYGATCGDGTLDSWDATAPVDTIAPETLSTTFTGLPGAGSTIHYARFYFSANGVLVWSEPIFLPNPSEIALDSALKLDAHLGDTLLLHSTLVSAGNNPSADVTVLLSATPDLADPTLFPLGTYLPGTPIDATLPIPPGTTHYIALLAEAPDGSADRTSPILVVTPAEPAFSAVTVVPDLWNATFQVNLTELGAGDATTVSLWTGTSPENLAPVATSSLTDPAPLSIPVDFGAFGTYYYQFRAENACASTSWVVTTPLSTLTLEDTSTYYWKSSVKEGDWSNPDNWETTSGDPRLTFPHGSNTRANFSRCTASTNIVHIDGIYSINRVEISATGLDLTFQGTSQEESRLSAPTESFNLAANQTLRVAGAYVYTKNVNFNNNSSVILTDAAYLYSITECVLGATDTTIAVSDDSTFFIRDYLLRMNGTRPTLRLHNGTFQQQGTFAPNSNSQAVGTLVEFSGTRPYLNPAYINPSEQTGTPIANAEHPLFRFIIPAEGFEPGPRIYLQNGTFPSTTRIPIRIEIAADSPWFQGGSTRTFQLVQAKSILVDAIDLADQPRPNNTRFYYTYGANASTEPDGNAPTGLWVEASGIGPTILYFR